LILSLRRAQAAGGAAENNTKPWLDYKTKIKAPSKNKNFLLIKTFPLLKLVGFWYIGGFSEFIVGL
jgi:hypothetical protein